MCCYFDSTSLSYCINIVVVPCLQVTTPTFDCRYLHCICWALCCEHQPKVTVLFQHTWHLFVHGASSSPFWSCDRDCLRGSILNTDDAEVRCPFAEYQCNSIITEREIRGVSRQTQQSTCTHRTNTTTHAT